MQEENVHIKAVLDTAEIRKKAWELAKKGRAEEGMAILEKAAKEYPENQFLFTFGMFYLLSEKKHLDNYSRYLEDWARIWAEQGRSEAALMLGRLYMQKEGKTKESMVWLKKAAASPDKETAGEAVCRLGEIYLHGGDDDAADGDKAETFLRKAADLGNTQSMYCLSQLYKDGVGLKPDQAKHHEWLQKAAHAGNGDACYEIAVSCMMDPHLHTTKEKIQAIKKALPFFEKGVKADHGGCCFVLGLIYLYGQGIRQDGKKGVQLLEEAASFGSSEAMMNLVSVYRGHIPGIKVKKNAAKAVSWLKEAADAGNMYAKEELGLTCMLGNGVRKDPEKGMQYLEEALRDGSSWAGFMMAVAYLGRDGIPQNLLKAEEYLRRTIFMNGPAADDAKEMLDQLKNKKWEDLPALSDMSPIKTARENQGPMDVFSIGR
jgi:TPR repeat protein